MGEEKGERETGRKSSVKEEKIAPFPAEDQRKKEAEEQDKIYTGPNM